MLPASIDGPDVEIGFNNRYLLEALKNCKNDEVIICLNRSENPVKIIPPESDDYTFLVLPMRLNKYVERFLVGYHDILEHESGERLEVDPFECDVAVDLFAQHLHGLVCNTGLHGRRLDRKDQSQYDRCDCDQDKPDYFQCLLDNYKGFISPTCKNSKNIG